MKKQTLFMALVLISLCSADVLSQSLEPVEWSQEHIFTQPPRVVGFREGNALLHYAIVRPMASTVHYGAFPADEDLCLPSFRFRTKAQEIGEKGGYEAALRVYRFEQDIYNMAKGSTLEGVVVYRVGILNEDDGIVNYYEGRFRCGKDDQEVWALRPCLIEGPFVDLITDRSATISLEADSSCFARVRVADRWIFSQDAQGHPLKARHHEIEIPRLSPSTRYIYTVEISSDLDFGKHTLAWPQRTFQTAPVLGSREPFAFAYMSDSRQNPGGGEYGFGGCNYRIAQQFMVDLYRRGADLVLFGGDLVNGYTSSKESFLRQLQTWKKAVEPVGSYLPIYETVGNHEQIGNYIRVNFADRESMVLFADRAGEESAEALFASQFVNPLGSIYKFGPPDPEDQWPGVGGDLTDALRELGLPHRKGPPYEETVYSFNFDNVHFVAFNTNYWYTGVYYGSRENVNLALQIAGGNREGYVMEKQLAWLKGDLDAAQNDEYIDWIVLFAHEPAFPNGGHLGDAMYWAGSDEKGGLNDPQVPSGDVIDMRNRFWGLVSSYSKSLVVLFGDEHNYSRTYVDDSIHPDYRYPVWQVTSGGAGAPFYGQDTSVPWTDKVRRFTSVPHYCLVMVHGKEVQLEVWTRSGRLVERVVLSDLPR